MTSLLMMLVYALVIVLFAYLVVHLLAKAGVNGTVRLIVYGIAALLILAMLLQAAGMVTFGLPELR